MITFVKNLHFGSFATRDNDAEHTIVLKPDGEVIYSPSLLQASEPQVGEYFLEGLPENRPLNVTVTAITLPPTSGQGGPSLTVRDFTHNNPMINEDGEATILLGATLVTSGDGRHIFSGDFDGTAELTIDY